MMQDILRAIAHGKEWSWSVIGLLAIIAGLSIRSFLLRDILHGMKVRNRNWYKKAQMHYQAHALLGWVFFAIFITGTMLFWRFEKLFLRYLNYQQWIIVLLGILVVSFFCHLRAYARAIVEAVDEQMAHDKDI